MFTTLVTLIFLHGGPGLPDYLSLVFKGKFGELKGEVFYTQKQEGVQGIEDLLTELDALVKKTPGQVYLIGHSWGGMLATEYALRYPDKISGLILISSAYSHAYKGVGRELLKKRGLGSDPLDIYLTPTERIAWGPYVKDLLAKLNSDLYARINHSYMSRFDNASHLRKAKFPILNIYGDQDYCIASSHERALGKLNRNIKNFEVKGGGHFPFLLPEHQSQVVEAIRTFLLTSPKSH